MPEVNDLVVALYTEQVRLRDELNKLREEKHDEEQKKHNDEKKQDDKKGGDQGDKDQGDKKDADDKDQNQKDQPPAAERAKGWAKSHPLAIVLGVILLIALIIGGWFLLRYLNSYESTDDAEVDGHTNPISSRIAGTVVGVYVEDGQTVARGQTMVDLDPRDYKVSLEAQLANLAQARANIEAQNPNVSITQTSQETAVSTSELDVATAEAGLAAAQQQLASSLADLAQAEANAANAAAEEVRYRALVDKQEVSREQYDQRRTEAIAQQAKVVARRATADAARNTIQQRQAAVAQAQKRAEETRRNTPRQIAIQRANVAARGAGIEAAQAQVDQAALNLSYCKIVSPVTGIIGNKTVEVGMQVAAGQELFALTPPNDIWVTANFKETQLRQMHPGQSVTIHVDTLSADFNGYIENMPGATGARYSLLPPENATGNYVKVVQRLPVRIRFKKDQQGLDRLRPGMSVEPKVWVQ